MILAQHNAHLVLIQAPAVAADPGLSISGSAASTRWQGDAQAYVDVDTIDIVRGDQRIQEQRVILDIPANVTTPDPEDLVTINRIDGDTEVYKVRFVDRGLSLMGRIRLLCRASSPAG